MIANHSGIDIYNLFWVMTEEQLRLVRSMTYSDFLEFIEKLDRRFGDCGDYYKSIEDTLNED